jgi:1-acyl-sn-glycerol-3-phosphate acyltransferase
MLLVRKQNHKPNSISLFTSLSRWFLSVLFSIIILTPNLLLCIFSWKQAFAVLQWWARIELKIFHIKLIVKDENYGKYDKPPYLIVLLNQTSLTEAMLMLACSPTPIHILTNFRFAVIPLLGWSFVLMGSVVIFKPWKQQAKRGVMKAAQKMRKGSNFYISIEGERSQDGKLSPYKKGPIVLALEAGAKIVPLSLKGARECLPYGSWKIQPGTVEFHYHKAIELDQYSYDDRDEILNQLMGLACRS